MKYLLAILCMALLGQGATAQTKQRNFLSRIKDGFASEIKIDT